MGRSDHPSPENLFISSIAKEANLAIDVALNSSSSSWIGDKSSTLGCDQIIFIYGDNETASLLKDHGASEILVASCNGQRKLKGRVWFNAAELEYMIN
jgi:hypothetical protein